MTPDQAAEIAALKSAIASGVKRVVTQNAGVRKEVEYQSLADMRKALEWLEDQASTGKRRVILAAF